MKWTFFKADWRPSILRTVDELTTIGDSKSIEEIHASLLQSGVTSENATKLVLFVLSAFAREMFEPDGVSFPECYTRDDGGGAVLRRIPYRREPIFREARAVAREFIDSGRFHEIDVVLLWSSEGKLIREAIASGASIRGAKFTELTHHF